MKKLRTYKVIRTIEEEYQVQATSKKHAAEMVCEGVNVISVKIIRENIYWIDKPFPLPKGWAVLQMNFNASDHSE